MFGSSFSHISATEFKKMLKNITAALPGIAFQLALEAVSPLLGGLTKWAKVLENWINNARINSSKTAKANVSAAAEATGYSSQETCPDLAIEIATRTAVPNNSTEVELVNQTTEPVYKMLSVGSTIPGSGLAESLIAPRPGAEPQPSSARSAATFDDAKDAVKGLLKRKWSVEVIFENATSMFWARRLHERRVSLVTPVVCGEVFLCDAQGNAEQVPASAGASVWGGLQGANHSHSEFHFRDAVAADGPVGCNDSTL